MLVALVIAGFFVSAYITARIEPSSYDSGTNLVTTTFMILIVFVVASFSTLTVTVDEQFLKIRFGKIFSKKFLLNEIATVKKVRNHWYCGWGIRFCFRPRMIIYNVYGLDAVEITMKNGKIYRIGTDEPDKLELAIR